MAQLRFINYHLNYDYDDNKHNDIQENGKYAFLSI